MDHSNIVRCVLSVAVVLAIGPAAQGVVVTIDANVTAEVQELLDGSVLNSDLAFDDLSVTTQNLPLVAEARLLPPTSAPSTPTSGVAAVATTEFRDPRLDPLNPPNEVSLDTIGFSASGSSTVTGHSLAVEIREVVFGQDEIDVAPGTAITAQSRFFLDGLLVLLGEPGETGLSGASTTLTIRVIQERSGSDPATVLEATVVLTGNANGTASLSVNGALTANNVTTFGFNGASFGQGTFQAVSLSGLAIPYTYPANVGEKFNLRAEVEARFEAPPGTGGVVVVGDKLNDLAAALEGALGSDLASSFTTGITIGLSGVSLPLKPLVASEQDTILTVAKDSGQSVPGLGGISCGPLGLESALVAAGLTVLGVARRRW